MQLYRWDATITCPAASSVATILALIDRNVRIFGGICGREKLKHWEKKLHP